MKTVLVSESGYKPEHDELLHALLQRGCRLFCAVGRDCEKWEDVMDDLAVGTGTDSVFVVTTSHPGEAVDDVVEFAESFDIGLLSGVDVIRV